MKRYVFSLVFCVCFLRSLAEVVVVDGFRYNLDINNYTAEVIEGSTNRTGSIVIPSYISYNGQSYCVKTIGSNAFSGASSITSISLPPTITYIGDCAFEGCVSLTSVELPNSLENVGTSVFRACNYLKNVKLSNTLKVIGESMFDNCWNLRTIVIPNSVTEIKARAFLLCEVLPSIDIPESVTRIGTYAFSECYELGNVTGAESVKTIEWGAFTFCSKLTSLSFPSLRELGAHAFGGCKNLSHFELPESTEIIHEGTFSECFSLESIIIPRSVRKIGLGAFYRCRSLREISIPDFVDEIGKQAFDGCLSLKEITIGFFLKTIGDNAFANCTDLETVTCYANPVPATSPDAFSNTPIMSCELNVPESSYDDYVSTKPWSDFNRYRKMHIPDFVVEKCSDSMGGAEDCSHLFDSEYGTKWGFNATGEDYVIFRPTKNDVVANSYVITTGNDNSRYPGRNPRKWKIFGSEMTSCPNEDSPSWIELASVDDDHILRDLDEYDFVFPLSVKDKSFNYYKLVIYDKTGFCQIGEFSISSKKYDYWKSLEADFSTVDMDGDEGASKIFDGDINTKWGFNGNGDDVSVIFHQEEVLSSIEGYYITTCGDSKRYPGRNPKSWTLYGAKGDSRPSVSSDSWEVVSDIMYDVELEDVNNEEFYFPISGHEGSYDYFMLVVHITPGVYYQIGEFRFKYTETDVLESGSCGDKAFYVLDVNGHLKIYGTGEIWNYNKRGGIVSTKNTDLVYKVSFSKGITSIGEYAFKDITATYYIPEGVTTIKKYAFAYTKYANRKYKSSVSWFYFPSTLSKIEPSAFYLNGNCYFYLKNSEYYVEDDYNLYTKDKSVLIHGQSPFMPNSVKKIADCAFSGATQTFYAIPSSVKEIGAHAFSGNPSLGRIEIPKSVTHIGDSAFHWCEYMTSVSIPNSVTRIGNGAFSDCRKLDYISLPNSLTTINDNLFASSGLSQIDIPESVTSIGSRAFSDCSNLSQIVIHESVKSIGSSAFAGCSNLSQINIPKSVTSIGSRAFFWCGLTSVDLPESISEIKEYTFSGCDNLKNISIPHAVTCIGSYAYSGCSNLASVDIPNGVEEIGEYAFSGCSTLTSVKLGESLKYIYDGAFYNCVSLHEVYCTAMTPPSQGSYKPFQYEVRKRCTLYVPVESMSLYKKNVDWNSFSKICPIGYEEIPGDVNGDGDVNIADAMAIYNVMAKKDTNQAADVNGDGYVNIADVMALYNIMAGK